jgi:hypothetical protein
MRQMMTFTAALLLLCLSCTRSIQPAATPTAVPTPIPTLTTAVPTPTLPPQLAVYTPEQIRIPCSFVVPAGATVECSLIRVPENRYGARPIRLS